MRVLRKFLRQNLDRHIAAQSRVARSIYFAHAPGADGRKDFVGAQPVTRRKWHT